MTRLRGHVITKKHYLVLKMTTTAPENRLLFIVFPDPYLIIDIDEIKLGETSSPT